MKLTYVTTKSYPATTADHIYIRELSRGFQSILKRDFCFLVVQKGDDLSDINTDIIKKYFKSKLLSTVIHLFLSRKKYKKYGTENVIVTNDYYIALVVYFLKILLFRQTKIIFDCHMLSETWIDSFILKRADNIICTSLVLASNVNAMIGNVSKIHVVWGGVSPEEYQGLRKEEKKSNIVKIGYVGGFKSLGKEKGLRTIIDSLDYLDSSYNVELIGGELHDVNELISYSKSKGFSDRVSLKEKITIQEVPKYLIDFDVLIIPYPDQKHFTNYGFPMKIYEYLSAKKPIVYSELKIMDDYLSEYSHCFSFIPDDASSLADVVQVASGYQGDYNYNIEEFSWKKKAQKIIEII